MPLFQPRERRHLRRNGNCPANHLFFETSNDSIRDADLIDFCQTQHLDESGQLALETQPKLLRFLDSKEIH